MENPPLAVEMPAASQEEAVNLRHYWHVILERRWLVITAFISVVVLSLIYVFKATPIYQATARLKIDKEQENVLRVESVSFSASQEESAYLQTQYKLLKSRTLIESVIKQLKLAEDKRYSKARDIVRAVAADITVTPIRLSRLVDISAEHPDARRAAEIVNTLISNFMDDNVDRKIRQGLWMVQKLETETSTQRTKLEEAEKAMSQYAMEHKQVSLEEGDNIVLQALKQHTLDYAKARSESAAAQEIVAAIDAAVNDPNASIITIPQVANNAAIQSLQKELAVLEADFAELQKRYKPKHPYYVRAVDKIESLKTSITNQANAVVDSFKSSAETALKTEGRLKELVDQQQQEQLKVEQERIQYGVLKRDAAAADLLYKTVLARAKETALNSNIKANNMVPVDLAQPPLGPVKPRKVLVICLGLVGGLGIAIGLAFFVNYLDDSIKSQDDVETYLRMPFLGYVPNIKTNSVVERDLQAHLHPQSNAAEGFRTLRASISLSPKSDRFHVLAVTSTIPSEGKSLVASNLAIVMAQTGLRTLLVDADLRRPSVHKAYQLHSPTGLSSYLMNETDDIGPVIHKTEVSNLDVICCGAVPSTPSELIGSKRMAEFLKLARGRYDRILLDSPPISAVSDPLIIAAMSDGVVFVTKFNKIRREHARKSIQRLQDAGIHLVGIVLNDIDFEGKDSYYYSYYYYQNRYYSSHYRSSGEKSSKDRANEKEKPVAPEMVKERNGH